MQELGQQAYERGCHCAQLAHEKLHLLGQRHAGKSDMVDLAKVGLTVAWGLLATDNRLCIIMTWGINCAIPKRICLGISLNNAARLDCLPHSLLGFNMQGLFHGLTGIGSGHVHIGIGLRIFTQSGNVHLVQSRGIGGELQADSKLR